VLARRCSKRGKKDAEVVAISIPRTPEPGLLPGDRNESYLTAAAGPSPSADSDASDITFRRSAGGCRVRNALIRVGSRGEQETNNISRYTQELVGYARNILTVG